ncbi:MAG: FtsX-like permease family protein [Bacteroidetes bacterium]|nr:FtsX-like permease family protein [Bacteroidota bacterium]
MAWRDSRRNRGRLLLFISSIVIGIAALVAINSFSENLQKDISREAKTLTGADLIVQGGQPATDSLRQIFDLLGEEKYAETWSLVSMVYFPKNGGTRLSQVRALEGEFPFYGKLSTEPADAAEEFKTASQPLNPAATHPPLGGEGGAVALVEKTLMLQFDLKVGDTVRVGTTPFVIAGQLNSAPGRAGIAGSIAPVVYIPKQYLQETGLVQPGSLVWYQYFFKFKEGTNVGDLKSTILDPALEKKPWEVETVEQRREQLGDAFGSMNTFLNLVGFIALLLGCIGVASSVHIYIKDKMPSIAVLRCIGASGGQAFRIFLLQVVALGLAGGILGATVGSLLQVLLPKVIGDFLPIENISADVSWRAMGLGVATGFGITVLFAMLPLLAIRRVSPLRTLRASYEEDTSGRDPWHWVIYTLIFLFICAFTLAQTGWSLEALFFPLGIGVAFLVLAGVAKALTWAVRKFFPTQWSYIWRQGIANLYRPNNQTLILIVTIGLGTALISTLFLTQDLLLKQVAYTGSGDVPNMIIFDVQPPQKEGVAKLTADQGLPVKQVVPIVTMRVETIDGVTKEMNDRDTTGKWEREKWEKENDGKRPPRRRGDDDDDGQNQPEKGPRRGWVYEREYRCTYRDSLIDTEEIVDGEWHGTVGPDGIIYVSLADNVAKGMRAKIGSKITFNVQGALVETVVGSIRKVDFRRVQTNFFIVFPKGVLEDAPQFYVVISRVDSEAQSAKFQQALVQAYPNVSVVDLKQILKSVKTVLDKVSFVIRFMALFSILTGLVVLISSVVLSKFQRIQESVLLRTLGAHRRQIVRINLVEYFLLGTLATFTGIGLSIVGSYALAKFALNIPYEPNLWPALITFLSITGLTVVIGLLNSREVLRKPPLEVLRKEV